jgi:hypothetical protein
LPLCTPFSQRMDMRDSMPFTPVVNVIQLSFFGSLS